MVAGNSRRTELRNQVIALVVFFIVLLLILNQVGLFKKRLPTSRVVTYVIDGNASVARITYTLVTGASSKPEEVKVPWTQSLTFDYTTTVILTAGNPTQTGNLRCQILLDGQPWKTESSKPGGDKVSCAGIVP
jgi:hypothetical protein